MGKRNYDFIDHKEIDGYKEFLDKLVGTHTPKSLYIVPDMAYHQHWIKTPIDGVLYEIRVPADDYGLPTEEEIVPARVEIEKSNVSNPEEQLHVYFDVNGKQFKGAVDEIRRNDERVWAAWWDNNGLE